MTPSWERLDAIERWLNEDGASSDPALRLEAELQLAEGRLDFAQTDRQRNPAAAVAHRVRASEEGFERVLRSSAASSGQLARARTGRDRARQFATAPQAVAVAPANFGGLPIIPRARWRPEPERTAQMEAASGRWDTLTVHHTAMEGVAEPGPGASEADSAAYLRRVQRAHMDGNGWADIGYEFLIDPEGRIFEGRRLNWIGAHVGRDDKAGVNNNVDNLGISMMGTFENRLPTAKALAALTATLEHFRALYRIPATRVRGHREWKATECPGDALMNWVTNYRGFGQSPATPASTNPSRSSSRPKSGTKGKIASLYGFPTSDVAPAR